MPGQKVGRSAPHETDAERCEEIAGEFYPNGEAAAAEPVGPAIKTKMPLGQSAGNLAGLERKLLNEFYEQPGRMPIGNGDKGHERQHEKASAQSNGTTTSNTTRKVIADASTLPHDGFLF